MTKKRGKTKTKKRLHLTEKELAKKIKLAKRFASQHPQSDQSSLKHKKKK